MASNSAGSQSAAVSRLGYCPNCGDERDARFCPNCGQNDRNYLRSLFPVVWELVRETFELDGRLLKSLRLLVTSPGTLAIEFSENRRAQYMSPVRMYLFVSIVFFFTLSFDAKIIPTEDAEITAAAADPVAVLDDENLEFFKSVLSPANRAAVDRIVARTGTMSRVVIISNANEFAEEFESVEDVSEIGRFINGQFVEMLDRPEAALDKLMDTLPFALFFLLPVYALLLRLFYLGSGRFYVEHLVFGSYLHTFVFLLMTMGMSLPASIIPLVSPVLQLAFLVYYFLALKRYYGQGLFLTTLKFVGLLICYTILLVPALLLVAVTAFALI